MRYPASEKLEIIRTVETSPLPVRRTLAQIGIPKSTFYAWLDRYAAGGFEALEDRKPRPERVWNRIPDDVRQRIIELALDEPELSPREIAVTFTDRKRSYVSEASVYRLLRAEGLLTTPAFIVIKAAERFANPTTAVNQLWQTDFTYLKVTGWGWYYLLALHRRLQAVHHHGGCGGDRDTGLGAAGIRTGLLSRRSAPAAAQRQRTILCRC